MTIAEAMAMYGVPDKTRFICSYPEWQEKRPESTFFADFSVADCYGEDAVKDTFKRAFGEWKKDYRMFTEFVMALNHKIWQHYESGNVALSRLYDSLWRKADAYGVEHLKGDELRHFLNVLDQGTSHMINSMPSPFQATAFCMQRTTMENEHQAQDDNYIIMVHAILDSDTGAPVDEHTLGELNVPQMIGMACAGVNGGTHSYDEENKVDIAHILGYDILYSVGNG